MWTAGGKGRTGSYGDGHQHSLGRLIEELPAITPPSRLNATVGRDSPPGARHGEPLNVHLQLSRFIRGVREPSSVRRESTVVFVELTVKVGTMLCILCRRISRRWHDPHVPFGFCI